MGNLPEHQPDEEAPPRINWNFMDRRKAYAFYNAVYEKLPPFPVHLCHNSVCRDVDHCSSLDSMWQEFITSVRDEAMRIYGPRSSRRLFVARLERSCSGKLC